MTELLPRYSALEEWANSLTHGIGTVLAIVGLVVLLMVIVACAWLTHAIRQMRKDICASTWMRWGVQAG